MSLAALEQAEVIDKRLAVDLLGGLEEEEQQPALMNGMLGKCVCALCVCTYAYSFTSPDFFYLCLDRSKISVFLTQVHLHVQMS